MKYILLLVATLCCSYAFGQDLLYTKNKGVLEVKVTEIDDDFIKYQLYDMNDGPLYTTTKRYVDSIVYQNGMVERFAQAPRRHRRADNRTIENALTNQFSGGVHIIGNDVNSTAFDNGTDMKNPFAVGVYIKYQKEILRKRVGVYIAPFVGLNKEAYGSAFGAKFNIKRFGNVTTAVGPEYILSIQDIIEKFYSNGIDVNSFGVNYYKKYRSAVSIMTFNWNMNVYINQNLSVSLDTGVGGVIGSSKRKENMFSRHDGYYQSGVVGSFRLGLGYWF